MSAVFGFEVLTLRGIFFRAGEREAKSETASPLCRILLRRILILEKNRNWGNYMGVKYTVS